MKSSQVLCCCVLLFSPPPLLLVLFFLALAAVSFSSLPWLVLVCNKTYPDAVLSLLHLHTASIMQRNAVTIVGGLLL